MNMKCPECNTEFELKEKQAFCPFCGCNISVDIENHETTITKNINISKNINHTKRIINDADVIRAKHESTKDSRDLKTTLSIFGMLILIPVIIFSCFFLNKTIAQQEGKINAGYSKDLIGKNYKTVEAHFESAGFTNIELIDLNDSGIAFWNDEKVTLISIGGKTDFESIDWFQPDTKVIISYH